ncbi:trehalose-6-phosphate synthase [Thermoplasma sp.]|uniref:alpha,alpha-trehalose-phosphate synthase (UDP-forming) n=1 Tax=Thermoplasma sp. TaxID=1973142 RepID=UPI00128A13BF|nr:trehalose-6-phosphate synthase [Thermoplasma sp.]KAA8922858.1 MAG: trehalose-6-phosphate synthase [Thermoplasma sp.]
MKYIVVSSRCPFSHDRVAGKEVIKENVGGVATALRRAMEKYGGTWICWGDGKLDGKYLDEDVGKYRIRRVMLSVPEKRGYYDLYSNRTLWPLFHYFRERVKYTDNGYEIYRRVNEKFASVIMQSLSKDDTIWIHDYQLSLIPKMLRDQGVSNRIIFTWHIPWVSREMFETLPESRDIIDSLSRSDFITFHTETYRKNFLDLLDSNSRVKSLVVPLGIDYRYFSRTKGTEIRSYALMDRKIIFSIDRLDYTKGLVNRALAIEELLRRHPDLVGKFVYVMIVTPSRTTVSDYVVMKRELEMHIGRINGEFGSISWMPILYMYRKISDRMLISYYKNADIALITPLIDGLNLVSKEFVAASERGILILSRFAGASNCLDGAVVVNPNSLGEVAEAIYNAMNMGQDEIQERLKRMKMEVSRRDTDWWIKRINALAMRKINDRTLA